MSKVYLLYYDFNNTSGNHAGMAYLAKYLKSQLANVRLLKTPNQEFKGGRHFSKVYALLMIVYLRLVLSKKDKIVFFEFLTKGVGHQDFIAKGLRLLGLKNKLVGLVHYSGEHLLEFYQNEEAIIEASSGVDKLLVFGSSLQTFLTGIGVKQKIETTFHYVDTSYYKPSSCDKNTAEALNILCLGALKRDFSKLKTIISQCPEAKFHVCMGRKNLQPIFEGLPNVNLYGFLSEEDLLALMQRCNASLSVLEDTVGSNVITSGLATALIQIVSDVGSIKDYCDYTNSIFCTNTHEFVVAIQRLSGDKGLRMIMEKSARQKSLQFSKESFLEKFNLLLN